MPYLSEDKIASIVERVVSRLKSGEQGVPVRPTPTVSPRPIQRPAAPAPNGNPSRASGNRGIFNDIDSAVAAAGEAFRQFQSVSLQTRYQIIAEMRRESHQHVQYLSDEAVKETGLGRADQKVSKNRLVIDKTPGPEILEPKAYSGDDGLTLEEWAPFGVIGAITPTTNPTETIICNGIGMLAAGNAVVFNVHPGAKGVSAYTVQFLNDAIMRAGGPANLMCGIAEPTIESAQQLMTHPGIRLLVVTGGPGVVAAAMKSGTKTIAAGPGNPPVVVDETADLEQAGDGLVKGISLDNNIVCVAEKEILVVDCVADGLKDSLERHGAYEMNPDEAAKVEKLIIKDGHVVKDWVGKDAAKILAEVGINAPRDTLIAFAETPEDHPFVQIELLTPVTGLVRYRTAEEAIDGAVRVEHGHNHTAGMYSRNIANLHLMARKCNCSIFCKNVPHYAGLGLGGEGFSSFTIASPTGEGLTNAKHFSRVRRCTLKEYFRIV